MGSGTSAMRQSSIQPLNFVGDMCDKYVVNCSCQNHAGGVSTCVSCRHTVTCKQDGKDYILVRLRKEEQSPSKQGKITLPSLGAHVSNKIMSGPEEPKQETHSFNEKAAVLTSAVLQHQNLNSYREVFCDESCAYLVTDSPAGMPLKEFLEEDHTPTKREIQLFMRGILRGLQHLHKHSIVGVNLSADDISMAGSRHSTFTSDDVKISHFGNHFAQTMLQDSSSKSSKDRIERAQKRRRHGDIWAAGELCYLLAVGESPFSSARAREASRTVLGASEVQEAFSSPQWSSVDEGTKDFVKCLMGAQLEGAQAHVFGEGDDADTCMHLLQHPYLLELPAQRRRLSLPLSTRCSSKAKISFDRSKPRTLGKQNSRRSFSRSDLIPEDHRVKHTAHKLPTKHELHQAEEARFWNNPSPNDIDAFFADRRSRVLVC